MCMSRSISYLYGVSPVEAAVLEGRAWEGLTGWGQLRRVQDDHVILASCGEVRGKWRGQEESGKWMQIHRSAVSGIAYAGTCFIKKMCIFHAF